MIQMGRTFTLKPNKARPNERQRLWSKNLDSSTVYVKEYRGRFTPATVATKAFPDSPDRRIDRSAAASRFLQTC
jgi:hypothetical protein